MIPAGYMLKHTAPPPGFGDLAAIHSVSGCIAPLFSGEHFTHWRHNGFWLYDDPATLDEIAAAEGIGTDGLTLFYYEVHPEEFDAAAGRWRPLPPPEPRPRVSIPTSPRLRGYDVVGFSTGAMPECSPLTCNGLWAQVPVNPSGLFATLSEARSALEAGFFRHAEPGPYRVFAVHEDARRAARAPA